MMVLFLRSVKPHPTLRFHRRFGKNIRVDESRSIALRTDDFQHGIVFTSRPLEHNESVSGNAWINMFIDVDERKQGETKF